MKTKLLLVAVLVSGFGVFGQTNVSLDYTASNPLPVLVVQDLQSGQVNYWGCCAAGLGFGFTVFGFGMVLRMSKKVVGSYD